MGPTVKKNGLLGGVLATFLLAASCAHAQFPDKPVRLVFPSEPGGIYDVIVRGRGIGQRLTEKWGQPVVIDHKPGAGSVIGTDNVAKSAPDGYSLLLISTALVNNEFLYKKLPYNSMTEMTAVIQIASSANVLVAHPATPASNIRELIALAKKSPGQLNFASSGSGSGGRLSMELLKQMANIELTHVPYKSSAPAMTAVIGGHAQLLITAIGSAIPHISSGRLKAIAVTGSRRAAALPNVPTIAESGVPEYSVEGWYGIFGPGKIPADVVRKLSQDIAEVMKRPDVVSYFNGEGLDVTVRSSEEFSQYLRSELKTWGPVIRDAKLRVD